MSGRGFSKMPAGRYKGCKLSEIPESYLRGFLQPKGARASKLARSIEIELERRRKAARS